jgi:predicted porin
MKRNLLSSTAMLVAAGIAAPAAAADKISLGLSGYYAFFGVAASQDDGVGEPGAGLRDHGVLRESEVNFLGETTLDNGLVVGVDIQLQGETVADQIDESYIYFEGGWGRLQLGSEDPASDEMIYGAPTPIAENGVNSPTFFHAASGANAVGTTSTYVNLTGDSDKVTYFTPRFHGFQFGLSYTPDNTEELGGGLRPDVTPAGATPQQSEAWEGAINWVGEFNGVEIGAYAAYAFAEVEGAAAGLPPLVGVEDQEMWGFGASFAYMGWTLGGGYRWTDQGLSGPSMDRWDGNIGLTYGWSNWQVGAAYGHGEVEVGAGAGEDTLDMVEVGVVYNIGPGIDLTGGVQFVDFDSDTGGPAAQNEAIIGLVGTVITF